MSKALVSVKGYTVGRLIIIEVFVRILSLNSSEVVSVECFF